MEHAILRSVVEDPTLEITYHQDATFVITWRSVGISFFLAVVILLFALLACSFTAPQAEPTALPTPPPTIAVLDSQDDVPRIGVAEAKAAVESGQAILVDVRSAASYARQRAAGALSIPLSRFETDIKTIPLAKDQWIITYCT